MYQPALNLSERLRQWEIKESLIKSTSSWASGEWLSETIAIDECMHVKWYI